MTCDEVREVAAELALGTLDGERRGDAVAHLAACARCRAEVAELARVTDALWLAAPEAEPPAGFEERVLRAVRGGRRWGDGPWRRLALVAAALVLVAAGVLAGAVVGRGDRAYASGPMRDRARVEVGHAVVSGDVPSYVYVTVHDWGESGDYLVEVIRDDGSHVVVAPIRLVDGHGAAGGRLTVPYDDVRAVWVTDAEHEEWCAFRM